VRVFQKSQVTKVTKVTSDMLPNVKMYCAQKCKSVQFILL